MRRIRDVSSFSFVAINVFHPHLLAPAFVTRNNMPTLNGHIQQCLQKMVHTAKKFISARDLLHQECLDKFKQANKSDARASIRSIIVGKGKIMSFKDIEEARAKRKKKEVA
jgi:hypothetical protein